MLSLIKVYVVDKLYKMQLIFKILNTLGIVKKPTGILIYSKYRCLKLDWVGIDLKAHAGSYFEYKNTIIRLSIYFNSLQ